jgi:transcriptional regulator with XRE-family HTH domain
MSTAVIHEFRTGRMTDNEYERERQRLRDAYGDTKKDAGVRFEQELARLFFKSGWTQEELATKEGKSQQWIAQRVRFGRFLDFTTTVVNLEKPLFSLTERRFREFWDKTTTTDDNERQRFQKVASMVEEAEVMLRQPPRPKIGPAIVKQFADGKYHRPEVIAKALDTTPKHVIFTVENLGHRRIAKVEKQKVGKDGPYPPGYKYRIFKKDREVSLEEAITKLTPIIKDLETQSHRAPGTVSNTEVGALAQKIRLILEQWAE